MKFWGIPKSSLIVYVFHCHEKRGRAGAPFLGVTKNVMDLERHFRLSRKTWEI
jgi:hypothetical protein